ncbi:MAG TPA: rhodanese-like domain-containing protein [Jiangellaceae bacterium]|nr:rhodanese-like domain-containing protein [Jiangellaceae bacterium]
MTPGEVSVQALAAALPSGAAVIDVREPDEYRAAHIPGAQLMPLSSVPARVDELPGDRAVYVVCAVGGRSFRAAEYLAALGVEAYNVAGGTQDWLSAGFPVVTGDEPGELSA